MPKKTLITIGIALTLLAYVRFIEKPSSVSQETTLYSLKVSEMTKIEMMDSGRTLTLERTPGTPWKILNQPEMQVDEAKLTPLLENFASPKVTPVDIPEKIAWENFGLETPAKSISLQISSGLTKTLHFGKKSPVGWNVYVRLEGVDKLYLLPEHQTRSLVTNAENFSKSFDP